MVAMLEAFPKVRVTFNLVPSLAGADRSVRREPRARSFSGVEPQAGRRTERQRSRSSSSRTSFHAQRERMIDIHPRYAELLARRGAARCPAGRTSRGMADRFGAGGPARSAGVAQARLDRSHSTWRQTLAVRGLLAKGPWLYRGGQADAARRRARTPQPGDSRHTERRVARGQIEISTSPFYHPILPLLCDTDIYLQHAPELADAAAPLRSSRGCGRTVVACRRASRAVVRTAAHRALAIGGLGLRRHGPARCARPALRGWPPTSRFWVARSRTAFWSDGQGQIEQPEPCTGPIRCPPAERTWRACFGITSCPT